MQRAAGENRRRKMGDARPDFNEGFRDPLSGLWRRSAASAGPPAHAVRCGNT